MKQHERIQQFLSSGYTHLSVRGIQEILDEIIIGFVSLLKETDLGKITFSYPESPDDADIGLIVRKGEKTTSGSYDQKIFFHYPVDDQLEQLLCIHNNHILIKYGYFLERCKALTIICRSALKIFARQFDEQTDKKLDLENYLCTNRDGIRILAYTDVRSDDPECIGRAHIDRCALTLSLFESHPGAEFSQSQNGPWEKLSPLLNQPLVFSSALLEQWSEDREFYPHIKAKWHRATLNDLGKNPFNDTIIRLVILFFCKLPLELRLTTH